MNTCLVSVCALAAAVAVPVSHVHAAGDPFELYGERIEFDVLRNGKPVGEHVTRFERLEDGLKVESDMRLKVQVFLFLKYEMDYSATEVWREGRLTNLDVDVEMGGDRTRIDGQLEDGVFIWDSPSGEQRAPQPLFPTNHWNAGVLGADRVLNTLTGNINSVSIQREEWEWVQTGEGRRAAYRYSYGGDLENEVWYDQAGRWVKLRFEAEDGSVIEYVCRLCGDEAGA